MQAKGDEISEDHSELLDQQNHQRRMEPVRMTVMGVTYPYPSVIRTTNHVEPSRPEQWLYPNLAVRPKLKSAERRVPIFRIGTVDSFDPPRSTIDIDFVSEIDKLRCRHYQVLRAGEKGLELCDDLCLSHNAS